jgi:hypothetical protein
MTNAMPNNEFPLKSQPRPVETTRREVTANEAEHVTAPVYGDASRAAIKAIITGMSEQNTRGLQALRAEIDQLEQLMLVSACKVNNDIDGHAAICRYVHEEVEHLQDMIAGIKKEHASTIVPEQDNLR